MEVENLYIKDIINKSGDTSNCSIAVHLHAFFMDVLPVFIDALQNIPVKFDCYVSVPETVNCNETILREELSALENIRDLVIKRTPNKGRDIAPMLCCFGDEMMSHDIILHLHTKKSLHDTGLDRWRDFILDHLLYNKDAVHAIIDSLSKDIGMVAPADFFLHLLKGGWNTSENIYQAQKILDNSSLSINLKKEYPEIDFPQGSMFWARTEYIKNLFDMNYTYDDFDDEPIPVDGTFAHALERLFFLWGKDTALKPAKLYIFNSEAYIHNYYSKENRRFKEKALLRLKKVRMLVYISVLLFILWIATLTYLLFVS